MGKLDSVSSFRFGFGLLLLAAVLLNLSDHVQGEEDVDKDDENMYELSENTDVRYKRSMIGVNMCFCCANKQLTMCCRACIKRRQDSHGSSLIKDEKSRDSSDRQGFSSGHMLSSRLSSLRMSACSCCAQTTNKKSRCCIWCGNMELV